MKSSQLDRIEKKLDWLHWAIKRLDDKSALSPQLVGFRAGGCAVMEKNLPKWPGGEDS